MDADLDVVIIGGGLQGLLALDALRGGGYSAVLATEGDLGEGQTIHSHGFLNTGFGMLGDNLSRTSAELIQPYLRANSVDPCGEWRVIPPPGFPSAAPAAPLPDGFDATLSAAALASPDRNIPKQRLIEVLARDLRPSILQGRAVLGSRDNALRTVVIHTPGGAVVRLGARAVVVAAGCGTKALCEELVGRTPQTEQIKHRRVHMICVRAPHGALPATSVVAMPLGLMLVAHDEDGAITWYATPMEFGGPEFDDVPHDAASVEDPSTLARGFQALQQLYPALNEAQSVRIGSYAGYRQDVGDMPSRPMCEPLAGAEDVIVALPSGLVPAWTNTERIHELVGAMGKPSVHQKSLEAGGRSPAVSIPVEDRPGFAWLSLAEFEREVREATGSG